MKVAIAMSGGVDSSVAAALLKEAGHEVFGLTMLLATENSAVADARDIAEKLGIPHYVVNLREEFTRRVITPFCQEYARGRTPNPCIVCNREIKFGLLWERAAALGADFIATGHYARVEHDGEGRCHLKKGADARKDQSYFLCRLTQAQLSHALFPVGGLTKPEVRRLAAERGLPAAARPESQEACFIPGGDYAGFVNDFLQRPPQPGPVLDEAGAVVGEHHGVAAYTIGQRRGLGVTASFPGRIYVTAIQPERNAIIVGSREQTFADGLAAGEINWFGPAPEFPIELKARVRYRHSEEPANITLLGKHEVYVKFTMPQMAITPGQTIAFYDGDEVIGGGTILRKGN